MSVSGLKAIVKKHILEDIIRSIHLTSQWKILVVDSPALKILNSACKMADLMDDNVTLIEPLERIRQPYPTLEALYLISPTMDSIQRVINDFTKSKQNRSGNLYAVAHLFFTSSLDDRLFFKLKSSAASQFIRTLKEIYLDFVPIESQCFTLDRGHSMISHFNPDVAHDIVLAEDKSMAKQLASFCITLGEFPHIRYTESSKSNGITGRFSKLLYDELEKHAQVAGADFPSPECANSSSVKTTLVILDRTVDTMSPLLHEFTYQAMANDLLTFTDDGTKYKYTYSSNTEGTREKEIVLDEGSDLLWASVRHTHIAECINNILSSFNKFLSENKAATGLGKAKGGVSSLKELKETLSSVPQFQELKTKFSVHINIAQECMIIFQRHKLAEIASVEQDLATGENADGGASRNIEIEMIPLLDDDSVSANDKVRLLMLYIIGKDGVKDEDRKKLLEHAHITSVETNAITNLALLGVKLTRSPGKQQKKVTNKQKKGGKRREDDVPYELSRYIPAIKTIMEELSENRLDKTQYPYICDPALPGSYGADNALKNASSASTGASSVPASSLRSTKPSWHTRKGASDANNTLGSATIADKNSVSADEKRRNGRIVIFVVGGMTFSEMRCAYDVGNAMKKEIFIGSSHIITPVKFIDDLKKLRQPFVPPTTAATPNQAEMQGAHSASANDLSKKSKFPIWKWLKGSK